MNSTVWSKHAGFTMIELLVTIVLVGLVFSIGMPFTRTWLDNARLIETESTLQQIISMTRAQAMRNPEGVELAGAPIAVVCPVADGDGNVELQVRRVAPAVANVPDGVPCGVVAADDASILWRTTLNQSVTVTLADGADTQPLNVIMFDSRGRLVSSAARCPAGQKCATSVESITLSVPNDKVEDLTFAAY